MVFVVCLLQLNPWSLGILGWLCTCILVLKGVSGQLMGVLNAATCLQYAVRK